MDEKCRAGEILFVVVVVSSPAEAFCVKVEHISFVDVCLWFFVFFKETYSIEHLET